MNKYFKGVLTGIIISIIVLSSSGYAESIKQTIEVIFNQINIEVNGQKVEADNILYNGTTYVPLRKITEMMDKEVSWNQETQTASITDKLSKILNKENSNFKLVSSNKAYIKIQNKLFLYGNGIGDVIQDNNGMYYCHYEVLGELMSINYNEYKLSKHSNPYIEGEIYRGNDYYEFERKYIDINNSYVEGYYFNKDKSKIYQIRDKRDDDIGIVRYDGSPYVLINDVFNKLDIKYSIEYDNKLKAIIIEFDNTFLDESKWREE